MRVIFTVECGEKTCHATPKRACFYLHTRDTGAVYLCSLFPDLHSDKAYTDLIEEAGQILRCPLCLRTVR